MNQYGGCIIADSVGHGKTFEALAIIKYFEIGMNRVLVLTPAKLYDNWNSFRGDYKDSFLHESFNYRIMFHTDLSRYSGMSRSGQPLDKLHVFFVILDCIQLELFVMLFCHNEVPPCVYNLLYYIFYSLNSHFDLYYLYSNSKHLDDQNKKITVVEIGVQLSLAVAICHCCGEELDYSEGREITFKGNICTHCDSRDIKVINNSIHELLRCKYRDKISMLRKDEEIPFF